MTLRLEPLRPDDPEDLARYNAQFNGAWPSFALTDDEFRHELSVAGPGRWWTLVDGEVPIGAVTVERMTWNSNDAPPMLFAAIDASIATTEHYALAARTAAEFARDEGFDELRTFHFDTELVPAAFVAALPGWREVEREVVVSLDLTKPVPAGRQLAPDVRMTTLADEPHLARSMHECQRLAVRDVPGDEVHDTPEFDVWMREHDTPSRRDDAVFLAVEPDADGADRVLGFAELELSAARPAIANHGYTAVHPDARGRGIAYALKFAAIGWCQAREYRELRTENEARNEPIRHINRVLGYAPLHDHVYYRGPIAPLLDAS